MAAKLLKHGATGFDPFRIGRPAAPLVVSRTAVGLMAALVLCLAGSTSALACAGGFLQAVLFHKYPEAKSTTAAITEARKSGTLKGDEWSKSSGKSLHAWRTEKTKLTVKALQKRLNSTENSSTTVVDTNVFLLNEFAWLRIKHDGERIVVFRQPYGLQMSEPNIFTSRRVLDELLNGGITWQQAIHQGLITSRCGTDCSSDTPFGLLTMATSAP